VRNHREPHGKAEYLDGLVNRVCGQEMKKAGELPAAN
jgi:hypothetical protein